jgi:hypothetical protein
MNEPLIRIERNEYEAVQSMPPREEKLRNTYWENTMLARLGIEALMSRLLTQIQHCTTLTNLTSYLIQVLPLQKNT